MTQRPPRAIHDLSNIKITQAPFETEELEALDTLNFVEDDKKHGFGWGKLLLGAVGVLFALAFGLWTDTLIRTLFKKYSVLGWFALGVAIIAFIALVIFVAREFFALRRLASVEHIRHSAREAVRRDDMAEARRALASLLSFTQSQPLCAQGRKTFGALDNDIIDGRALIHLAESEILRPLDLEARALILASAKRVSIITAVSPKALVDIGYVLYESARLIRALATLYNCRPGQFGVFAIGRKVLSHLAVTGSIAMGDSLVQQLIGQGLATRLSARLGEGLVNGLMTTRIGIAAMDTLRPFPFDGEKRPGVSEFAGDIAGFNRQTKI